jgi:hypothetical protein
VVTAPTPPTTTVTVFGIDDDDATSDDDLATIAGTADIPGLPALETTTVWPCTGFAITALGAGGLASEEGRERRVMVMCSPSPVLSTSSCLMMGVGVVVMMGVGVWVEEVEVRSR